MQSFQPVGTRSAAIKQMLKQSNAEDLYDLYSVDMECQVLVAQDNGYILSKEYRGPGGLRYTNDRETWFSFRIPKNAMSEPEYFDSPMSFDLAEHAEAIGMTGWNWADRRSIFVAYDFDSLLGHSDGLTLSEIEEVKHKAFEIPWVTVRKSTSGTGIHLYVFLDFKETVNNHTEHAALARSILNKMSAVAGYNFSAKVDICGGNMWCWARKMIGTDGLTILKEGCTLSEIPPNWRDHVPVIQKKSTRIILDDGNKLSTALNERRYVTLDEIHKQIIGRLDGTLSWWDADRNLLVTHTASLKRIHEELDLKGVFDTVAEGKLEGQDYNCYCLPLTEGAFIVYRFSEVVEHPMWFRDSRGISYCYFNRDPDLKTMARVYQGIEREKGGFIFESAEVACQVLEPLGIYPNVDLKYTQRQTIIQEHKDGRIIVKILREDMDTPLEGWEPTKDKRWTRIFTPMKKAPTDLIPRSIALNDSIRHIVDQADSDAGWVIQAQDGWNTEPLVHIRAALKSMGYATKEIDYIIGTSITNCWIEVSKPFLPEYPGNREWNRNAPQLSVEPSVSEERSYPHWMSILRHCGQSLDLAVAEDEWCRTHGIHHGSDYLKCWVASLFQKPEAPLPYLFLYGPQNCGKSIFHEALSLLFNPGYVRADLAVTNAGGFTGELANAVLCVIEETDLRNNKVAYNRIKDWVTSLELVIHRKGSTPYQIRNVTHWIQCANDRQACPIFPGDSRIVVMEVPELSAITPKDFLISSLKSEAPDFLAEVLSLDLPPSPDRLNLPPITSEQKVVVMESNTDALERFLSENVHHVYGEYILVKDMYESFTSSLDPQEQVTWGSKIRMGKEMPSKYPKGRLVTNNQVAFGNCSFEKKEHTPFIYVLTERGSLLKRERK